MSDPERRSAPKPGRSSESRKSSEHRSAPEPAVAADESIPARAVCRDRLGLALAGGGFRAALFHVGVFHRLAELDLLRYVEVLSTVSGGSIVGALYVLLLKRELERKEGKVRLEPQDYRRIVDDLEARLVAGIRRNLRTRLFANPFDLLSVLVTPGRALGDRMAELYEEYIFRDTIRELERESPGGPFRLQELLIKPGCKPIAHWLPGGDIDSYNRAQVENGGSAVTKLVINATSLNTGARFVFKATEFGEWHYGYVRVQEAGELAARKREIDAILCEPKERREADIANEANRRLARWVITGVRSHLPAAARELMESWAPRFDVDSGRGRGLGLEALRTAELGLLRQARIAAWFMRRRLRNPTFMESGGFTFEEHRLNLIIALGLITQDYPARVQAWLDANARRVEPLCNLIDEVYLYRSARNVAASIETDASAWRLSQAVAASANYPPIFPPLLVLGTYDDLLVSQLGLTDGGVYDNLGVVGLADEGCNYIISSDTGLTEKPVQHVSQGRFGMINRIFGIAAEGAARQMRSLLIDRHMVSAGLEAVYRDLLGEGPALASGVELVHATRRLYGYAGVRIDSVVVCGLERRAEREQGGRLPAFDAAAVGAIRTDLDGFGDIETNALINQGYANAGLYVKQWLDYADRRAAEDERPLHARRRYAAGACGDYAYAAARESGYRDARTHPLRPIANATGNDRRADWAVRVGRFQFFRVLYWRYPPDAWFIGAWAALFAAVAVVFWFRGAIAAKLSMLPAAPFQIGWVSILSAALALAVAYLWRERVGSWIDFWMHRAEDAGRLRLARFLAQVRRLPGRLAFWLALAGAAAFVAAFLSAAPERALGGALLDALEILLELVLAVGGIVLISVLAWLAWLDGWVAAASQRLDRTGRPPGGDGPVR